MKQYKVVIRNRIDMLWIDEGQIEEE